MMYAQINWDGEGGLFLFPRETQQKVLNDLGRDAYIKLPAIGTNPRGVEITTNAVRQLAAQPDSLRLPIQWEEQAIAYDPHKRWIDLWQE